MAKIKEVNVTPEEMKKMIGNKPVCDLGVVTLHNEKDRELLTKYIEAIKDGNTMYKPFGLDIKKRG